MAHRSKARRKRPAQRRTVRPRQIAHLATRLKPITAAEAITPGPRKESLAKKPKIHCRHHKARSVWFQQRASWPLREAPIRRLVAERERVESTLAPVPQ